VKYAIRIPANESMERDIAEMLTRPVGRPSHKPVVWYKSFLYQAGSWKTARRVVAKVEFHCGELFPRVGFIVTNLEADSRAVVRFYNRRGTAEQWDKRRQTGGEDDAIVILFTSGSEKDPKAVQLTHRNIISNIRSFTRSRECLTGTPCSPISPTSMSLVKLLTSGCLSRKG
jgi:acyl-CoA synthetase (AMP-forming)/AMP-acid ligase II